MNLKPIIFVSSCLVLSTAPLQNTYSAQEPFDKEAFKESMLELCDPCTDSEERLTHDNRIDMSNRLRSSGYGGSNNKAALSQSGQGNDAVIKQSGFQNNNSVYQNGHQNQLKSKQIGAQNDFSVQQEDTNNLIHSEQMGSDNQQHFEQSGHQNELEFGQYGNSHKATIIYAGCICFICRKKRISNHIVHALLHFSQLILH